ncbi:Uncharacterised protein [Mycobacteroides abscessus subsp. abscessus]|uniref:Uncharacterized protein n=1 Tax=Mycobacteroides abscessus subsp. bolletii TaxID=319705 RepID=A0A9Q7WKF1_9MYCO|nr:hypothetical protein [Mycobacteroides abscessus]SHU56041.1 Uncharacterised protein [Mycobacteroides abscessus subsp. bolletii]SHU74069.1 Uncharacterised protein [Mycobacteroides abscessus subsp. bolletii]SHX83018.1 Uncharacterised protein [Mycobacteroides abscessus subsp. bolletii]SIE10947.1 Uncharacterised protein [Mycobacteroides abscessus subsp. abscessus]SIG01695.1 Uncharacterised protein [Mycobacteroides abscessus subsp. abscessus]
MRSAVVGEWVVVTGGWSLFRTMREQTLTPDLARKVAQWCSERGDFESAAELRWAAGEAEKWVSEQEWVESVSVDIIERIDELLSMDSMSWSPMSESEVARILAGEQDERPRPLPVGQIHVISVEQVVEWTDWWDGLSESDQHDTPWYVVCFRCMTAGERSVDCGCGNPRTDR